MLGRPLKLYKSRKKNRMYWVLSLEGIPHRGKSIHRGIKQETAGIVGKVTSNSTCPKLEDRKTKW